MVVPIKRINGVEKIASFKGLKKKNVMCVFKVNLKLRNMPRYHTEEESKTE